MNYNPKAYIISLIASIVFLFSCETKQVEKVCESPNQNVMVEILSIQQAVLAPFMTRVIVKGYGHDDTLSFEVYNSNLTKEDIMMDWKNENSGVLTFIESDKKRRFHLTIDRNKISLRE